MILDTQFDGTVQIKKIRSRGRFGGVIFSCVSLDENPKRYVVKASNKLVRSPALFKEHHLWNVKGKVSEQVVTWKDGSTATEWIITPDSLAFVQARQENLKSLLSNSKDFQGISSVKAEKLVSFFGDDLYDIAENNDLERLLPILGKEVAQRLIDGLNNFEELKALRVLDELGVPSRVGRSVIDIWGSEAHKVICRNPYMLIAFMADLSAIDSYAIDRLGFAGNCPERLIGYVKGCLFDAFSSGNTCLPEKVLKQRLNRVLKGSVSPETAIEVAYENGEVVLLDGMVQAKSMELIESTVAKIFTSLSNGKKNISDASVLERIESFEATEGFSLTVEQEQAVVDSCQNSLTVLTGGAGCGKTTVLNAICKSLEELGETSQILMMALSGKAAKRMTEASGRDAMTIAGFIYNMDAEEIADDAVFIVDEASMVDILSLLQVLRRFPKNGRLILTGDPEQLPPVGVGLGLHLLVNLSNLSNPHLTVVKRQSSESGIPSIADAVRNYANSQDEINFSEYNGVGNGVCFIDAKEGELTQTVVDVYSELGGNGESNEVLILSAVKAGSGGVHELNSSIHSNFAIGSSLLFEDEGFGRFHYNINQQPLKIGDLVMYKRNDYERDIRNGSVGRILSQSDRSIIVDFDGNQIPFELSDLKDFEFAYAMTVHKSQGSQFDRVVVSIRESRNLDRHLIYTAITRAKYQVVFVGDREAFYDALSRSNAGSRCVLLDKYIETESVELVH